jgi:hypothetical protein
MYTASIDKRRGEPVKISMLLEENSLNSIRRVLPDRIIREGCQAADYTYRNRILTPIVTVMHMLLAALWPEASFLAAWQVMWFSLKSNAGNLEVQSASPGSLSKARMRLPLAVWHHIFDWISHQAQELSQPLDKWLGLRVVLLDGMCVSMPESASLFKAFGRGKGRCGRYRYPLARLVAMSLANTMTVISYALGSYHTDETFLAAGLLETLRKGDILLADRHFAGAHFYVRYQRAGLEFLTRAHQRLKISRLKRIVTYSKNDFVGRLNIGKMYRRKDPTLPASIQVRLICSKMLIRGRLRTIWLVSSLLDADCYPAEEIVKLYARRWRIETLFGELKIEMSARVLRSKSPQQIRKEVAARVIALNVVRTIMLTAALDNGVDPLRISFVAAVRAIISFAPAMATERIFKLPLIYRAMLAEIAAHIVEERPGRNEPRQVVRDPRQYPLLKITRAQWRKQNAA